jgi:hypothetical protein
MSRLSEIKERAQQLKQQVQNRGDEQNLGPDRGTMDQEQARIERARQEARKEAERERVKERVQEEREQTKEQVKEGKDPSDDSIGSRIVETISTAAEAVDDGDNEQLDDVNRAMQSDFDGDGEALGAELGFQTQSRAQEENQALTQLGQRVDDNRDDINSLNRGSQSSGGSTGGGGGGFGGGSLEDMGFGTDDGDGFGAGSLEDMGISEDDIGGGLGGGSLEDMGFDADDDGGLF